MLSNNRQSIPAFKNQISLDLETGHLYLANPVLSLQGPVVVIRHGETSANTRRVLQGVSDTADNQLHARGRQQAEDLARTVYTQMLDRYGLTQLCHLLQTKRVRAFTSPLGRAKSTGEALVRHVFRHTGCHLAVEELAGLVEMNFGKADGLSLSEMLDARLDHVVETTRLFLTQHASVTFDGGESFLDVLHRSMAVITHLNTVFHDAKTVLCLVFTHSVMSSALRAIVGDPSILATDGRIDFRDKRLGLAMPCWLSCSQAETRS
jgi:broad specificity phosphatase PhoE